LVLTPFAERISKSVKALSRPVKLFSKPLFNLSGKFIFKLLNAF
jgi:hypothetical protein